MSSSPLRPGADLKEQLDWYKIQYAQLETDLSEFQASSKELEEQLEKDVEAAEKSERKWKEQVEKLTFEVEEWKTKHKQAKNESNSAQTALQKEITTLRETNRTMQLKLRDIEVMNDDYERQARNTESSLEDLESKYNSAIEQRVMLDEEIKISEQEREALRIEAQRLRDELSDLKVESEITLEKLRLAGETITTLRNRRPTQLAVEGLRTRSPLSDASGMTPLSPTASTPPPKSDTEAVTPPSPPLSDAAPTNVKADPRTPAPVRRRVAVQDPTPKPGLYSARAPARHTRGTSIASSAGTAQSGTSDVRSMRPPVARTRAPRPSHGLSETASRTESLSQIRGLIGRMQKIEARVHSARSKLPAPSNNTTPRGSPRTAYPPLSEQIPSSITMRRSSKRTSASISSSALQSEDSAVETTAPPTTRRESHVKRLSFGIPRPTSTASASTGHQDLPSRPASALDGSSNISRPASRQSLAGGIPRPASRTGARTAEPGHYPSNAEAGAGIPRARSSIGGSYTSLHSGTVRGHRTSASVSELRRKANEAAEQDEYEATGSTTNRRSTLDRSGIPAPGSVLPRRQSGGLPKPLTKRVSQNHFGQVAEEEGGSGGGSMAPPPRKRMSDVGETY